MPGNPLHVSSLVFRTSPRVGRRARRRGIRLSLQRVLLEAARYFSGSQRSRRRQLEAMRYLDDHLRRDIGLPPRGDSSS